MHILFTYRTIFPFLAHCVVINSLVQIYNYSLHTLIDIPMIFGSLDACRKGLTEMYIPNLKKFKNDNMHETIFIILWNKSTFLFDTLKILATSHLYSCTFTHRSFLQQFNNNRHLLCVTINFSTLLLPHFDLKSRSQWKWKRSGKRTTFRSDNG